jgi:hypothetical protein
MIMASAAYFISVGKKTCQASSALAVRLRIM